ncbi:hypothetical protein GQ607_006976 [Colletotrichum asianum]|uniref:Uncharacterized protein n=1 Tax=Colletotrichum asianum TaxID=702518 RepID=A0A8H3WF36_9PEZI|nr:hypothetical protein GQ607_006976 [Colletotrichum asianum]
MGGRWEWERPSTGLGVGNETQGRAGQGIRKLICLTTPGIREWKARGRKEATPIIKNGNSDTRHATSFLPLFLLFFFFFKVETPAVDRKGRESTYPAPPQVAYLKVPRSSIAELPPYQLTSAGDPWGKEKAGRSPVVRLKTFRRRNWSVLLVGRLGMALH